MTGELLWSGTPAQGMGRVLELRRAPQGRLAVVICSAGRTTAVLTREQARALALQLLSACSPPPGAGGGPQFSDPG